MGFNKLFLCSLGCFLGVSLPLFAEPNLNKLAEKELSLPSAKQTQNSHISTIQIAPLKYYEENPSLKRSYTLGIQFTPVLRESAKLPTSTFLLKGTFNNLPLIGLTIPLFISNAQTQDGYIMGSLGYNSTSIHLQTESSNPWQKEKLNIILASLGLGYSYYYKKNVKLGFEIEQNLQKLYVPSNTSTLQWSEESLVTSINIFSEYKINPHRWIKTSYLYYDLLSSQKPTFENGLRIVLRSEL